MYCVPGFRALSAVLAIGANPVAVVFRSAAFQIAFNTCLCCSFCRLKAELVGISFEIGNQNFLGKDPQVYHSQLIAIVSFVPARSEDPDFILPIDVCPVSAG